MRLALASLALAVRFTTKTSHKNLLGGAPPSKSFSWLPRSLRAIYSGARSSCPDSSRILYLCAPCHRAPGESSMSRSNRDPAVFVSLASAILLSCAGSALLPAPTAAQTSSDRSVIYLNQGWSQDDREWYYNFSQGSAILSYDIFLNLEVAGGQELFRSDANSVRYGLIPGAPNRINPDGLPIGISKTTMATTIGDWSAGDYAGPTCAACHETQLNYKGKRVRIDGGAGNTFDIQAYILALNAATRETL